MSGIPADKCKAPRAFWHAVERLGLPASALLRQARLPATLHLNEHAFVTTAQYFELWRALEDLCPEPALGIR
ncbi:MAG: AraC family transcriptional regulator, partial [Mesorhizobium sp.]